MTEFIQNDGSVTSAATQHPEPTRQPAPDVVEDCKFWLSIREPGMVPRRKGPWLTKQAVEILREMMDAWPTAYIDYITLDYEGAPQIEHGPEILQMLDGRSMSKGRKHNQRVKDAEAALQARPDNALVGKLAKLIPYLSSGHPEDCASARFQFKQLCLDNAETILSALRTHDDTLEDAAKVADTFAQFKRDNPDSRSVHELTATDIAGAIRNLKGKANG